MATVGSAIACDRLRLYGNSSLCDRLRFAICDPRLSTIFCDRMKTSLKCRKDNKHKHKDTTFDSGTLEVIRGSLFFSVFDCKACSPENRTLYFEKNTQAMISYSHNMILSQNKNIYNFQISRFPNFQTSKLR